MSIQLQPQVQDIWDISLDLPVYELFQHTNFKIDNNGYYKKFEQYVITCKNDRTNQIKDKHCITCNTTYRQCNPRSKANLCYNWVSLDKCCNNHNTEKTSFTKCKCGGKLKEQCRTLQASTARTYWGVLLPIICAHPLFNEWTIEHLISKNVVGFIRWCQKFYGTIKNAHDVTNPSQKRENMIKPSLTRFFEWLRKEADFKRIREDRSNVETTYCSNCRCGHPDCSQLGKFSCHNKVLTVKILNGDIKVFEEEVCTHGAFQCSCCQQYFAICQYRMWLIRNEGCSMASALCNLCVVKQTLSRKSYNKVNAEEQVKSLQILGQKKKEGASEVEKKIMESEEFKNLLRSFQNGEINREEYNKRRERIKAPILEEEKKVLFNETEKEKEVAAAIKIHELATQGVIYEPYLSIHQTWCKLRKELPKMKRKYENLVDIDKIKANIKATVNVLNDVDRSTEGRKKKCRKVVKSIVAHKWKCSDKTVDVDLYGDLRHNGVAVRLKEKRSDNLLNGDASF